MGWRPRDLRGASIWEFAECFQGWKAFHAAPEPEDAAGEPADLPTEEQHNAALNAAWDVLNPGVPKPDGWAH